MERSDEARREDALYDRIGQLRRTNRRQDKRIKELEAEKQGKVNDMSKKEYMHEWLKADAVVYDLPSEEIIQQLANDNEELCKRIKELEAENKKLNSW